MAETLHNAPIVLDNGSGTIRAGFAGEDLPKCYFPSFVGRPKHLRVLAGALEGDVFIGQRAQELRGLLKIRYPLEHGIVTDWDDMERIWQFVYTEELKTLSEEVRDVCPRPLETSAWVIRSRTSSHMTDSFGIVLTASSAPDRGPTQSESKSRHRCANTLRNLQCPCPLHLDPSRAISIRIWSNNRDCPRRR